MSALILPRRHYSQPQVAAEVDPSWLSAGLVSAYNVSGAHYPISEDGSVYGQYSGVRSSATHGRFTLHGYYSNGASEAPVVATDHGFALDFDGTANTRANNVAHPKPGSNPATFIVRALLRDITAPQHVIGHSNMGLSPPYLYGCAIQIGAGEVHAVGAYNNSRRLSVAAPSGRWVTLAAITNTTAGKLYVDGKLVAAGDLSGSLNSYPFSLGSSGQHNGGASSPGTFNGLIGAALTFHAALSDSEVESLSENPYQILRQSPRRIYFDIASGGGGVTGSMAAAESGSDVAGAAGNVAVSGVLAAAESGADAAALSGVVAIVGTIATTESGSDTAAFTGDASSGVFGALAAVESGSDVAAMAGAVAIAGSLAANESGADTAAFAGTAAGPITGSLAATEDGHDTAAFRGPIVDTGATGGWLRLPQPRFRTKAEIDDERRRLGILPQKVAEVVREVAREAAQQPAVKKAEIRRDFKRELAEYKAQYRAEYLRALYAEIEFQRLLQQQAEEEEAVAVLLMALAA